MTIPTYEGVVENGRIKLPPGVILPEKATVYVVVPDPEGRRAVHIASPRLAHPEQAADFLKIEVIPEGTD